MDLRSQPSRRRVRDVPEAAYPVARRSERKRLTTAVLLLIEGEETEEHALALDVSQHGIRLQPTIALTRGQFAQVIFDSNPDRVVPSRVVWVGRVGSDQEGQVGLEFLNPLPTSA